MYGPVPAAAGPAKKGCVSPVTAIIVIVVLLLAAYAAACLWAAPQLQSMGVPNLFGAPAAPASTSKPLTAEEKARLREEKAKKDAAKDETGEPARERRDEEPAEPSLDTGEVQLDPSGMGGGTFAPGGPPAPAAEPASEGQAPAYAPASPDGAPPGARGFARGPERRGPPVPPADAAPARNP